MAVFDNFGDAVRDQDHRVVYLRQASSVARPMALLRDLYADDERSQALVAAVRDNRELVLGACQGGLAGALIAASVRALGMSWPRLIVCGNPAALRDDLVELGITAEVLSEIDRFDHMEDGTADIDRASHNRRVAAVEAYAAGAVLVADPRAVQQPVPDLAEVAKQSIVVKPGEEHDLHQLVDRLVEAGYKVVATVEGRGELAVRGGVIDVYPWIGESALRLEFFGDQVESVRRFDVFTQESIAKADEAVLATAAGSLALKPLWSQLPPGPVLVVADLPLRGRLDHDHGRREVRIARQLEEGAIDGASLGTDRFKGDLQRGLIDVCKALAEVDGGRLVLLARNEEAEKEMAGHCRDHGVVAEIQVGRLSGGWRDQERGLLVLHDYELAAREPAKRRVGSRVAGGAPLSSLTDLKHGDHVVHIRHGIGVFRGMATLEKRGFLEDYLVLEFAEEAKLYVPVDAIDMVQKYVGASGSRPDLATIGGTAWAKKRAKADKAIEDISADLLEIHARRIAAGGVAFAADTPEQRRFEAAFPYEETEDQLSATREIKADMEKSVAMDRLLCGDVGFGKTEVAMRAAYKAASSGHQVAVMAPTTLLAEQHLETFTERFAGSGFTIAGLTRFNTPAERRDVLAKATTGHVDIIIGTHALLTDDLAFANLGLLVIDEEHRFGVKHKEKMRAIRVDGGKGKIVPPDVLTLSATPIPRTLHFSLLGIRDISVLAEPPSERLAVETRVAPWDEKLIKSAITRELERKGQVFFVHNRVQDLDNIVFKLSRLLPELKLDSIHGQMPEARIAKAMDDYRHNRLQCLVSTSIIESGIDIPNANTLFVNNAHFFGLAELHQIRGRIGRRTEQAYAFFLVPGNKELTQEARDRLDAIQEYAELGAGFKLAMRDLELRGAGNLLGGEQSGHIDAIGYELYTKLLGEAVARMKEKAEPGSANKASATRAAPSYEAQRNLLGLPVDAYIPDTYLETPALKFEIHKHLDGCRRLSDVAALAASARDRFGAFPEPVLRLFAIKALRLRCAELAIAKLEVQDRQIRLHLAGPLPAELAKAKLPELVHLQLDGSVLVLFFKPKLDQDTALRLLARLLAIELSFLGAGF